MKTAIISLAISITAGLALGSPALAQESRPSATDPRPADPGAKPADEKPTAADATAGPKAPDAKTAEAKTERKPLVITPRTPPTPERPGEGRLGETAPAVPHQPGFIAPLTRSTDKGRVGVAGWTAPNVPTGSAVAGAPDHNGAFGFGIAAEWSGSPRPKRGLN